MAEFDRAAAERLLASITWDRLVPDVAVWMLVLRAALAELDRLAAENARLRVALQQVADYGTITPAAYEQKYPGDERDGTTIARDALNSETP